MLRWKRPQNKNADELDEHNLPTEPLLNAIEAPVPYGEIAPTEKVLPAPQLYEQPSPPVAAIYPVLPPVPVMPQGHHPAGSAMPLQPANAQRPTRSVQPGRSHIPTFVGIFFVALQLLLLISFIARLVSLPSYQQWLGVIYGISSIFLLPFRLLFERLTLPFSLPIGVEVYTLVAILVYGLLSRLLVHLLKELLRRR